MFWTFRTEKCISEKVAAARSTWAPPESSRWVYPVEAGISVSADTLTIYGLRAGPTLSLHVSGIPLPIYGPTRQFLQLASAVLGSGSFGAGGLSVSLLASGTGCSSGTSVWYFSVILQNV